MENQLKRSRLLLLMCFLVYSISYIGKYSYSTNIQNIITEFSVTKAHAGYATSAFFFCYGIGQLVNGIICERLNSKWAITLSVVASSMITYLMFFLKNVFVMAVLWGINGLILSVLWCHCIKLLATIHTEGYAVKSATVMSLTLPVGIVCAYGCSALFTYLNFWRLTYLFSASALLIIGIAFFLTVRRIECRAEKEAETEKPLEKNRRGGSLLQTFGWMLLPLIFICVSTGLLRDGSSTWLPTLLSDTYSLPDYFSILFTLGLPLMGVFTAKLSATLIKKMKNIFGSCLIAGIISVLVMAILVFAFQTSLVLLVGLFMILSLAGYILGNTLTSIVPLYYKKQLKSGQTAGIFNACIYLGSTISTLFLGGVIDDWGWQAFMIALLVFAVVIVAMALIGMFVKTKNQMSEES